MSAGAGRTGPAPACPRCGYDQSGAMAAWERNEPPACPLKGVCSECGLEFEWGNVLNPERLERAMFFETARERRARAWLVTAWRVLRPRRFWGWVRMEQPVAPLRMAAVVLGVAPLLAVAMFAALKVAGWCSGRLRASLFGRFGPAEGWSDLFLLRRGDGWALYWSEGRYNGPRAWVVIALAAVVLMPLVFGLLPVTLRRAKVRRRHLLRVWAYGLALLPLAAAGPALLAEAARAAILVDIRLNGPGYWLEGLGAWLYRRNWVPGVACLALWLVWWWHAAAGRYMKLPRPLLVAVAMTVVSLLLPVAVVAAAPGGLVWMVWDQ